MVRRVPRARAGLSRLAASLAPLPAGADQGVGFVDEQNDRLGRGLNFVDHAAQALLELAFHAGAGLEQAHVQRADAHVLQRRRHVARQDALHEAFDDGGLADAGFAGEDRIVLAAAHEDVHALADFLVATDDGIDFALAGLFGEVHGESFQRLLFAHLGGRHRAAGFARGRAGAQAGAVAGAHRVLRRAARQSSQIRR